MSWAKYKFWVGGVQSQTFDTTIKQQKNQWIQWVGLQGADSPPYSPLPVRSVGFLVVVWHKNSCHHWITRYIKIWSIQYQLISQYFSTYLVCSLIKAFFFLVELGLHPPIINSRIPPKAYGELKPFLSSFKILSMVLKKVCLESGV